MGRVSGKVAIVTGAARGLGAEFSRRLIEEGAKVTLTDVLDKVGQETKAALGGNARFLHLDVTSEAEWKHIVSETEKAFGPVSVLVNNAGILSTGPIETFEEAEFRRIVDVNQLSVFLGIKSVLPSMKLAGGGSIINISSSGGIVGLPYALAYTGTKFAVRGMTKSAAIDLAPYNIRVNSIHPGFMRTEMSVPSVPNPELAQVVSTITAATPANRIGEPVEVANVVLLLASDEARFATGTEFVVDGGLTCR